MSLPSRPSFLPTPPVAATVPANSLSTHPPPSAASPRVPAPGTFPPASPAPSPHLRTALPGAATAAGGAAAPLPWPTQLEAGQATTTAQLIELGEGWVVRYRAWKAPARCLDPPLPVDAAADLLAWDPLAPACASSSATSAAAARKLASSTASSKGDDAAGPPSKKAKKGGPAARGAGNAFDELLAEELGSSTPALGGHPSPSLGTPLGSPSLLGPASAAPPPPTTRLPSALRAAMTAAASSSSSTAAADVGPSTASPAHGSASPDSDSSPSSRLRARLSALRAAAPSDPLALAEAHLAQRAAHARDDGRDRLALLSWVGSATVRVGGRAASAKGKGKAREGDEAAPKRERSEEREGDEGREGEGRALWVFGVVRGGETDAEGVKLDDLTFEGLEPFASGEFTHSSLFPALYSAAKSASSPTCASPLSLPAHAYPSALAISDALVSIPLIAQPPPPQTLVQAAYESFRSAISNILLDELVQQPVPDTRCVRLGASVVFLPLAAPTSSTSSSIRFAPLSPRPALELSLAPLALNRSSIHLQSRLAHLALAPLPPHVDAGARVRLAPLDARATFLRALRLPSSRRAQLDAEWTPHVAGACGSVAEPDRTQYVLCALDAPGGTAATSGDRVEVVWPRALVLLDGEREQAPSAARDGEQKAAASEPSPERPAAATSAAPVTSAVAPVAPPSRAFPGAPLRARLAGQLLLRGRTSGRRRGSEGSSAGDVGQAGAFRSPVKRRTGDVWRWMGDEGRRREEERENAARREAEKDARDKEAAEAQAPESAAGKDDDKVVASAHLPAAAPINMRTPMSLGASSTEAPSPAELFSSSLHPIHAGAAHPPPPSSTVGGHDQSHDTLHGMDIDFGLGMYPSPAEPAGPHAPAPVSTSAPMSTLETAFPEFDWGDGTFGTSGMSGGGGGGAGGGGGGQGGGRGNDGNGGGYDDGIMLGLTDDDFSFFDAPTPGPGVSSLALSMPPPPLAPVAGDLGLSTMPSVSGMDAAFDLFSSSAPSDLPGMTSTVSTFAADPALTSTTSPQFPEGPSPALPFSFGAFDALTPNALELASTSPGAAALAAGPYSPVVLPTASATPASLALVPHTPHPVSYSPIIVGHASPQVSPGRARALSAFEPVAFDPAQAALDDKYDPRRGKFGLPSPDSDHEGRALVHPSAQSKDRRSWYSAVCDPRIALAERLRRQRLGPAKPPTQSSRLHCGASSSATAAAAPPPPPPHRAWVRRRLGAALGLVGGSIEGGSPSTSQHTADEADSEQSSSDSEKDDAMDVDRSPRAGRDSDDEPHDAEADRSLDAAFSSSLLAAVSFVKRGVEASSAAQYVLSSQDGAKVDPARDLTYHVVTEHLMHLPDLRDATLAFSRRPRRTSMAIASHALAIASTALAAVCSTLSPSPLFADHTALASLEQEDAPAFLLRTQQCVVETSCAAVDFWRPMGFEPLPGAKSVTAFVVYEDSGAEVHDTVKEWFRAIGSTYEGLRLGSHTPGTVPASNNFAGVQDGLVPLPAGLLSTSQQREELKLLYTALSDTSKTAQNTVVYLIAPLADSPLAQGSPLASIIHQVGKSRHGASAVNMLPCTIPMASLARSGPSTSTSSTAGRLARLAFSVYDQLQIPVERLRFPMPETFPSARPPPLAPLGPAIRLYTAPAVNVAPAASSRAVQFSLSWPPMALEVEHRHRLLHVCYTSRRLAEDSEQECLVVATVDEKGESWKVAPRLIKAPVGPLADVQRVRLVWSFVKSLVDAVDVEWRIVLCKLGEPTGLEAKTWDSLLKEYLAVVRRPLHVTFACAELDPALAVLPRHAFPAQSSAASFTSIEDGQASVAGSVGSVGSGKTTLFDATPTTLTYTPTEPVSLSTLAFTPAASSYFLHVPRISSHAHSTVDLGSPIDPSSTSAYAVHFFLSHASRTSSYKATLGALVGDVRRSFVELAALGQVRWGTSGRLAWHLEATGLALLLAEQLS
ncbi:hypothetical protein JCM3775_003565 [Rhodotorula graminis]